MIENQKNHKIRLFNLPLLSTRIRHFRELRNFTQEYVACELGLSQNSYSRLERNPGRLSLSRMNRIIKVLEISLEDLVRDQDSYHLSR